MDYNAGGVLLAAGGSGGDKELKKYIGKPDGKSSVTKAKLKNQNKKTNLII